MEEIIKKILEIEQKALEITGEAKDQKAHFDECLKKEAAELRASYFERVNQRIQTVQKVEQDALVEKTQEIRAHTEQQLDRLNQIYAQKKDGFIEDIVSSVLS